MPKSKKENIPKKSRTLKNKSKTPDKVISVISKKKKTLVIATDSYLPRWDGISRFLSEIIPELHDIYDIKVIAPRFEGKHFISSKIEEILLPLRNLVVGDYQVPLTIKNKIYPVIKSADLVWTQTIGPIGNIVINISSKLNKKIFSYIHSIEWELVSRSINKPILIDPVTAFVRNYAKSRYNKSNLLMVPSKATGDILQWRKIKSRMGVVSLGVNTNKFLPPIDKEASKLKLGIDPSIKVIGYAGRIAYEKNLSTLVRAFIRLKEEYDNIMLLLVGDGVEELKRKFSKVKGIKMVGSTDNVIPYLQAMDVYVLSSLTETTSLSTLEAMSCETPVIVTPVGDVDHYIINNVNGLKYSKENSYELTINLRKMLDNPALRRRLGKAARQTVIEKYAWKKSVERIKYIFEKSI